MNMKKLMTYKKSIGVIAGIVVLVTAVFAGFHGQLPIALNQADASGCSISSDLSGWNFNRTGGSVTVTNKSSSCSYQIGLSSYQVYASGSQQLFDQDDVTISPGQTETLSVNLPSCSYQLDFYQGTSQQN